MTGQVIQWSIFFLIITASVWMLVRNQRVYRFRQQINRLCYLWSIKHIEEEPAWMWCYKALPKYAVMFWSFKPLRLECWLSKDILDRLLETKKIRQK